MIASFHRLSLTRHMVWSLSITALALLAGQTHAIMPTAGLDIHNADGTWTTIWASQASFGTYPGMTARNNVALPLAHAPEDNSLLCQNETYPRSDIAGTLLLVPRGTCTFEQKAWNAQRLGAKGMIVYGALESRYSVNATTDSIVYPLQYYDYDCKRGRAEIPLSAVELPYNAEQNDPLLSGSSDSNLCRQNSPDGLGHCSSQACLLTGNTNADNQSMEACCAWDTYIWLYSDPALDSIDITIPAVYITMEQGNMLLAEMQRSGGSIMAILYTRYRSNYNLSSVLIWMLGVFVAALAAYLSAGDFHYWTRKAIKRARQQDEQEGTPAEDGLERDHPPQHVQAVTAYPQPAPPPDESLELNVWHALGFVVMASTGLFVLFFFKIYGVVKVMYALGCSKAVSQVLFYPVLRRAAKNFRFKDRIVWRTGTVDFGDITLLDICAHIMGYTLGITWLLIAFLVRHPDELLFFWVTQDVMGACMCILFLSVIKLNSIRVAALLLLVAFFYDIFFVFITPLIFKGESVMITVATSGGPPKADPSWCEKYPDDANCQGGEPLPMLLTVPRIEDYQGGSSLLGLGDIVLPGLLLSFAARLDAAKSLLGVIGGGNGILNSYACPEEKFCSGCRLCSGGYFAPLVVAYAVGLLMANTAVYVMNMGQPALLYLVPCCLGTITFMGWRRNELKGLWHGPKAIRTADSLVYGTFDSSASSTNSPNASNHNAPSEGGIEAPATSDGDVPLLENSSHSAERRLL